MPSRYDFTGQRFSKLLVIKRSEEDGSKWICQCDCGNIALVTTTHLHQGAVKSCGCVINRHGLSGTPEHTAWTNMIQRCYNPNYPNFIWYGQRGITVCDKWRNSFPHFILDMGYRPSKDHSLDRYPDMNGNYEPGNCRWATLSEQHGNTRTNVYYEYQGEPFTQAELARRVGMSDNLLSHRINVQGKTVEEAISAELPIKHIYTYNGETKTLKQWSIDFNILYDTLYKRLTRGNYTFEEAIKMK